MIATATTKIHWERVITKHGYKTVQFPGVSMKKCLLSAGIIMKLFVIMNAPKKKHVYP